MYHRSMERRADRRRRHIIYRTTCVSTGRYYVGMHSTDDLDDGYMGSGKRLCRSIAKHGVNNHVRTIVEECVDRAALVKREEEIINSDLLKDPLCMNLVRGGKGGAQPGERNSFFGRRHTPETIRRISASMKNERGPCYGRSGDKHPMFGKRHTAEASKKMSAAHAGKQLTQAHVNAIRRGHAHRTQARQRRDAAIIDMVRNHKLTRKEAAERCGVGINIVYGAFDRLKRSAAINSQLREQSTVVCSEGRTDRIDEHTGMHPPDQTCLVGVNFARDNTNERR